MSERMPTVSQFAWSQLIPQCLAVLLLSLGVYAAHLDVGTSLFFGALIYLIICRLMRSKYTREFSAGVRAYKSERFDDAIRHFEASRVFFLAHPQIDRWRSLLLGVASRHPYRVIALGNMAFCYGQIGQGKRAIELYEQALQECPDYKLAKASLGMLRSVSRDSATA
jgi:tetratricopeptide (TPR) repeat protein